MKLTAARKELYEGLQIVGRAIPAHTTLPALGNVLIEPGVEAVRLAAADLALAVEVLVPAHVQEGGPITVPVRPLAGIVAALPEADISLTADDTSRVVLRCCGAEYRLHGLTAEEFPSLPEVKGHAAVRLPQPLMKSMVRQTVLAASDDDTRPIMTGVSLALQGGRLVLAATDTHRLAVRTAPVTEATGDAPVIVPARALNELVRILSDEEEAVLDMRIDQNQILFRTERVTLVSRLIDGEFPKYERVIPSAYTQRLTIPRKELQAALRRARIIAQGAISVDQVLCSTQGDSLVITAEGEEGQAREEIGVGREGDEISIALSARYLLDVLGVLDCEEIFLELTSPMNPAVVRPAGGDDYLMVIMPIMRRE